MDVVISKTFKDAVEKTARGMGKEDSLRMIHPFDGYIVSVREDYSDNLFCKFTAAELEIGGIGIFYVFQERI